MAKGGGISSGKGGGGGGGPTAQGTLNVLDMHASNTGRAVIADMRRDMPGTPEQQDAMLKQLQVDGKVVLMKDDRGAADKNQRWQEGGVKFAGVDPRVFAYRVK